jgi:hypothetical protein
MDITSPEYMAMLSKFFRTMRESGITFDGPIQDPQKLSNLIEYLRLGCPKVKDISKNIKLPTGMALMRNILGVDFIGPEEISKVQGCFYTKEELKILDKKLPDMATVVWMKSNGYALMATLTYELTLLGVRNLLARHLFCGKNGRVWYEAEEEKFSREELLSKVSWLAIRKNVVVDSFNKSWPEQKTLISSSEFIPSAVEMAYFITTYYKVNKIRLFEKVYARTSSVSGGKECTVALGIFDDSGLAFNAWGDDLSHEQGLATARKLF